MEQFSGSFKELYEAAESSVWWHRRARACICVSLEDGVEQVVGWEAQYRTMKLRKQAVALHVCHRRSFREILSIKIYPGYHYCNKTLGWTPIDSETQYLEGGRHIFGG